MPANRSGAGLSNPAVTMFVFLPRSARARIVATDLLANADKRRWRYSGGRSISGDGERFFVIGVLIAHVGCRRRSLDRLHVLLRAHLHGQHVLYDVLLDAVEHVGEKLERFTLVLLLRILLRVTAQVDALAQVIQRGKVLAPVLIDHLQHQIALEGM